MLSEPISVTYDSVPVSLNRVSYGGPSSDSPALYAEPNGEFELSINQFKQADGTRSTEVFFSRTEQDADGNPFTGSWSALPNRFGIVFERNTLNYNSDADLPLLRAAVLAFVDSTVMSKLMNGES